MKKMHRVKMKEASRNACQTFRYRHLEACDAFEAIITQGQRKSLTTFVYSDQVATYSLWLGEGTVRLECHVASVRIYSHSSNLASVLPRYAKKLSRLRAVEIGALTSTIRELARGNSSQDTQKGVNVRSAPEVRDAAKNFRESTRAQAHVRSRKPCDDMAFGRGPGHIGDLK